MQPSELETRRITIWEQMGEIEGELFLLSARSGGLDLKNGHRFERLCAERTQRARELLLNEHRWPFLHKSFLRSHQSGSAASLP
jgi:hypothetical protein